MTEAELLAQIHQLAHEATIGAAEWVARARDPKYPWRQTKYGQILLAADQIRQTPPTPIPPPPASPYGTAMDAAPFAGRGIMLGSQKPTWEQALGLARDNHLEVVASIPAALAAVKEMFKDTATRIVEWVPPEVHTLGDIHQAENQGEWDRNVLHGEKGICCNSWKYGKFTDKVALVECYYNEGWGVDFNIFKNYMAREAKAVIPVCGGWSATGRSDAESARLYASLSISVDTPGFWMYAGESMLTEESVAVLKAWKP